MNRIRKKAKSVSRAKIEAEVSELESGISVIASGYRLHAVAIDGVKYISLDARAINRGLNQGGRGDYRYLVQGGSVVGLAVHQLSGKYRRVA